MFFFLQVFATDNHDWMILFTEVPGKLKSLHADGYRIVFITNQAGIATGKVCRNYFFFVLIVFGYFIVYHKYYNQKYGRSRLAV